MGKATKKIFLGAALFVEETVGDSNVFRAAWVRRHFVGSLNSSQCFLVASQGWFVDSIQYFGQIPTIRLSDGTCERGRCVMLAQLWRTTEADLP